MDTFLIISVFLIAVAALALRRWNRQSPPTETHSLPETRRFDGLFAEQLSEELKAMARAEAKLRADEARELLIARAANGDETALDDAHKLGDKEVYADALAALIAQAAGSAERLRFLADYIVDSAQLPSSREFAETMIEVYQDSLNQRSLADMLHLAALTGDAELYRRAIEIVMARWREGRVLKVSATDILATIESGYWLISSEARLSGSGFLLKKAIAEVRRELAAAARRSPSISAN
ncbi:MAG: hypothetical protein AB7U82_29245 [Blastocatellales bacterium]